MKGDVGSQGETLRKQRELAGLTTDDAARFLGVSEIRVSDVEGGRGRLGSDEASWLERFYNSARYMKRLTLPAIGETVVAAIGTGFRLCFGRVVEHRLGDRFRCEGDDFWFLLSGEWLGPYDQPRPIGMTWRRLGPVDEGPDGHISSRSSGSVDPYWLSLISVSSGLSPDDVCVVGELNPYGADPRTALYHLPRGKSGDRLRKIVGLSDGKYARLKKMNLCTGKWSDEAAASEVTRLVRSKIFDERALILLGTRVRRAFEVVGVRLPGPFVAAGRVASLPHPSGRCRLWNGREGVLRAREVLRAVAPWVDWGVVEASIRPSGP
jgi:hypothetical protein